MLPGSPQKGRRRRLINGVRGAFGDNTYTSIEESSSSRDMRKRMIRSTSSSSSRNNTTLFQPTYDASEEHGYRIDVAKDGSMITAVPIHHDNNPQQRNAPTAMNKNNNAPAVRRRVSPILYSDARVVSPNASINQSLSTHALLDARGNQRQKMKRARPPTVTKQSPAQQHEHQKIDPTNAAGGKSPIRLARDQLRKAKGLVPTFSGSPNRKESQFRSSPLKGGRRSSKVTWDLDEPQSTTQQSINLQTNSSVDDDISFGSFPILSNHNFGDDVADNEVTEQMKRIHNKEHTKPNASQKDGDVTFEESLQRRMEEIEFRRAELEKAMTHKDMMKGTLISAFDQNLEKNRKQMTSLEDELKTIRWHLSLEQHEQDKNGSKKILQQKMQNNVAKQAEDPLPAFDLESVGDPSITADTDSVADLFGKGKSGQMKKKKGLDPPARPSPSPPTDEDRVGNNHSYNLERRDLRGSRVSAEGKNEQQGGIRLKKPKPIHPAPSFHGTSLHGTNPQEKPMKQMWQNGQALPPRPRITSAKTVHFNVSRESEGVKFDNDSVDNLSTDFQATSMDDGDDISWQGEHFDVDMYDDQSGGLISSEHHDIYRWKDDKRHVVTSEHYVRENHHHRDQNERQGQSHGFNGSRGVSSASVEPDLDLSFVHAVAAVVIQTAVRRFLAELVAEERRYAVQVIQAAAIFWMDRRFGQPEQPSNTGYAAPIMSHNAHIPQYRSSQERTKRVMFKDEYEDVSNFAATEIQRCFRGWLTRDTLEVDDFAATSIQRVFRGWWMRETMEVDRFCATEIQRIVRGHLCRMNYIYDLYCITVAQSVCRRFLAFNKSAIRLANVLYIQAIYRGYMVRSNLSRYVTEGQEVAATLIQTQWRSYDAQMNFIDALADILIVQSVARRWLTLRRQEVKNWNMSKRKKQPAAAIYGRKQLMIDPSARSRNDSHQVWKEHRLNVVERKKQVHKSEYPEAFSDIVEDVRFYDGNASETSDFLQNWRGRRS